MLNRFERTFRAAEIYSGGAEFFHPPLRCLPMRYPQLIEIVR